ncbi:MAG: DEAD/DEAH box helicase [Planctomycetes bacterium]|nr:DEAD/DEAH box helicase [Planctomycetota bacterium]
MSFDHLGLSKALLRAVEDKGYESPSPIQAKAIPAVLSGKDVLAAAQTGTGKTAGFTLPLLQMLSDNQREKVNGKRPVRVLIMAPTRELASQINESVKEYSAHLDMRSTVVFGGVKINPQIAQLRGGVDILVATPGRLLDLQGQGAVDLSQIEHLVLDEADRMLDMGFIPDIKRIIKLVPKKRQNLLFSATFSKEIRELTKFLLDEPLSISVAPANSTANNLEQDVYLVKQNKKTNLLKDLINEGKWSQVLVFTRTKHRANRLSDKLNNFNISSAAIHGNKSQNARTKALSDFKEGKVKILVATDIAARGLDIKQLPRVINFELPNVPEDYVHRIGRTGRAGASGHAISLVCSDEIEYMNNIEKLIKKSFSIVKTDGFSKESPKAKPQNRRRPRPNNSYAKGPGNRNQNQDKKQNAQGSTPSQHPKQPKRPRKHNRTRNPAKKASAES